MKKFLLMGAIIAIALLVGVATADPGTPATPGCGNYGITYDEGPGDPNGDPNTPQGDEFTVQEVPPGGIRMIGIHTKYGMPVACPQTGQNEFANEGPGVGPPGHPYSYTWTWRFFEGTGPPGTYHFQLDITQYRTADGAPVKTTCYSGTAAPK